MKNLIRMEDNFEDVLGKAVNGLQVNLAELSQISGINIRRINKLLDGELDRKALLAVAECLNLHGPSLLDLAERKWRPEPVNLEGLLQYTTPYPVPGYEEMTVNSYLVFDKVSGQAAAFDTGASVQAMLQDLEEKQLTLNLILLTHTHADHIQALTELREATGSPEVWVNEREPVRTASTFQEGKTFTLGNLSIESRLTNGHSPGGTTFLVSGLEKPVAIVGDSLFSGSQGGASAAYSLALENNRKKILSLDKEVILCPGHGPMTTVDEEQAHNPFFPELKA